jgi:carboxylate-amine ligase
MLGAMSVRSVGVEEELLLVEPETGQPQALAGSVMEAVSQAAGAPGRQAGDAGTAADLLAAVLARGNGAAFQRRAYERAGHLRDVVASAVAAAAG